MNKKIYEWADEMRINPTYSEKQFSERLKSEKIKFKSQVVLGYYIVDFIIGEKCVVEIDGYSHKNRKKYDLRRTLFLEKMGYHVIRIKNKNVNTFNLKIFEKYKEESIYINIPKGKGVRQLVKKRVNKKHSWSCI